VNDVRDFIKKMTERNDISYSKAYNIMNAYKKEMENNAAQHQNNNMNNNIQNNNEANNLKLVDKMGKRTPTNLSGNFVNNSNASLSHNTPKYSSNILSKNKEGGATNNIKLVNNSNNLLTPILNNNENNPNENIDNKGNINIKFINHNINHFIISNNGNNSSGNNTAEGYPNSNKAGGINSSKNNSSLIQQMKSTGSNFMNANNALQSPLAKDSQKPEKKSKKINAFRNVAKPLTALGNQFSNVNNKELAIKSSNLNRIPNNNIRVPENFDSYLNKTPNTPNNNIQIYGSNGGNNYKSNNNLDNNNIMVNFSQPIQPGIFNKYNMKQLNINSGEFSPVNRATRGSISLHSTINKNMNNNSLRFSKQENQNQYSRPSSASNSKNKPSNNSHLRDKSSNSMKDQYNNPSIISTFKRTPSTNSLVKGLTRNHSKPTVGNDKGNSNPNAPNNPNNAKGFLNINRQTPKNYSGSIDLNKNGEFVRNSFNSNINMIGIEKPKTGNKHMNSNNLNIKAPTINR